MSQLTPLANLIQNFLLCLGENIVCAPRNFRSHVTYSITTEYVPFPATKRFNLTRCTQNLKDIGSSKFVILSLKEPILGCQDPVMNFGREKYKAIMHYSLFFFSNSLRRFMTNLKLTRKRSALNPEPSILCNSSWKKINTMTIFKLKLVQKLTPVRRQIM